ncbi:MAG: hypothetical protein ACJAVS_001358 [Paracoccaceae bacterium]|jgi:hypothetical protein
MLNRKLTKPYFEPSPPLAGVAMRICDQQLTDFIFLNKPDHGPCTKVLDSRKFHPSQPWPIPQNAENQELRKT